MANDTMAPGQHVNSDRFAVRSAVTAIRNAFMQIDQQQLLSYGAAERRASARVRLNVPIQIVPANVDAGECLVQLGDGPAVEGLCRDISLGGMGLIHLAPFPGHQAIVRFELPGEEWVGLVIEKVWSNPTPDGTWGSGVRILGLTDAPGERGT